MALGPPAGGAYASDRDIKGQCKPVSQEPASSHLQKSQAASAFRPPCPVPGLSDPCAEMTSQWFRVQVLESATAYLLHDLGPVT